MTGSSDFPNGNSDYTFVLDGTVVGVFQKIPDGKGLTFNQTVYRNTSLENTQHTLRIEAGAAGNQALILLDAIINSYVLSYASCSEAKSVKSAQ